MWSIFSLNVLKAMMTFQYARDVEGFARFYANEYDACIKRGGDMMYGVNVINGNVNGMADVIAQALKKGIALKGSNYNLLEEICPAAFEAYWMGAEMSPLPNPLFRPLGWQSTPPAPGAIMNIGPNPISLAASAAIHKAEVEALKALEDELKKQTITIPAVPPLVEITIPVYETAQKVLNKEPVDKSIKDNPIIKAAIEIIRKLKEAKKKKPSIGSQIKKAIKIPFPELPDRQKIMDEAKDKLMEEAIAQIKENLIAPIEEQILQPIISVVQTAVELANSIPNPKPTPEQIKKFVKDTAKGLVPEITLPGISIPKIPTKEELKKMVEDMLPTEEEIKAMAYDTIKGLIPEIPYINFVMPTLVFSYPTNILIGPFINAAQQHLMGVGGTMMVMAQYPPPAPPAPAILQWSGYTIMG
ncbi:MAG: hypothetical protein ACO21H_07425 [Sediminibacterium sp.]|jgi:hypothetical protein